MVDTQRGTTLGNGEWSVGCVEHLMAALYGLEVDNARIEVRGPEFPAVDGSALPWVELIEQAGITALEAPRRIGVLKNVVWAGDESGFAVAVPWSNPAPEQLEGKRAHCHAPLLASQREGLALAVGVEFRGTVAGRQSLWMQMTTRRFTEDLAPSRTFVMDHELQALKKAGLAKGGSAENAFAVGPQGYSGVLRFDDEVVRHKTLDLVGDLALCGWRFDGLVLAVRPSHRINVELARALRAEFESAARRNSG